jgi:serine/threonine protein kinase
MTERSIFLDALDIDEPGARAAFLERACAGDPGLRAQVDRLLAAHEKDGPFLEGPAPELMATVDQPAVAERPGRVIGPYKLMEQIGEGGFGLVFVAEQAHPVRRRVALKVIKPGMDTREVIARFEAERQALALMDHPNIARVFDAGATESGRPYFVMELVKGIPITEYCDQAQLTPRERLELFVPVCQAVQHAHQKGVIHRDLKPSNVLVTLQDGTPVVKVIDFGVAKAIGQHLTDKTVYTRFAQVIGTPLYMSPEQAEMSGLDVDARSDVYSLGVLLYELLTGSTPFDRQRFGAAAFDEIRRIIREEEPPRPSTRLTSMGQALTAVSARRRTEPERLPALVRGDLDWIVMKALEKDRRRYETVGAFAADVRRFLAEEPVEARPPTSLYRLGKLARRNRAALTTVALVAVALTLGTAAATWQAVRATRAEVRALAERDAKERARAEAVSARERAEEFADRLRRASALASRGQVHALGGRLADAGAAFARAQDLQPDLVAIYVSRGPMYEALGLWDLAAADMERAEALTGGDPPWGSPDWYQYALLRLHVADQDGYRRACRRVLREYGDTTDQWAALHAVRACTLAPDPPVDPPELVQRAGRANASQRAGWRLYIEGLADHRAGGHRRAVDRLNEALKIDPDWKARALCYPPLAMAHYRLGEADEARRAMASADEALDLWAGAAIGMPPGMMPVPWFDWLEFQLLHREAKRLLTGSTPPEDPRVRAVRRRALALLAEADAAPALDRARASARRGDWGAAAAEYSRALDLLADDLQPHGSAARACYEASQWPEVFDALVRLRPGDARPWVARGRSLARRRRWGEALAAYARVMDSRPPDGLAMLEYASLRLLAGDEDGYGRLRAGLAERYGTSADPEIAVSLASARWPRAMWQPAPGRWPGPSCGRSGGVPPWPGPPTRPGRPTSARAGSRKPSAPSGSPRG